MVIIQNIFSALASLKLAVVVIFSIALSLCVATILESFYDSAVARYFVYDSIWFSVVLTLFGVNILFSAAKRWPWKKKHAAFLMAHCGILLLLIGSWVSKNFGIDASLRLATGERSDKLVADKNFFWVQDDQGFHVKQIHWQPPFVSFSPIKLSSKIEVSQYLTHADSEVIFEPDSRATHPAIQLRVQSTFMGINQSFWLWSELDNWKFLELGPARFEFQMKTVSQGQPIFSVLIDQQGNFNIISQSSSHISKQIHLSAKEALGKSIDLSELSWKIPVKVTILNLYPQAIGKIKCLKSDTQYGNQAPVSAIEVIFDSNKKDTFWLSLGSRMQVTLSSGKTVEMGYMPNEIPLPFVVELEKFEIEHDPGTTKPAAFKSTVNIFSPHEDPVKAIVQMNEPFSRAGFTLYQASYDAGIDPQNHSMASVFSVNSDPARMIKYFGSFWLVLGAIYLFVEKYLKQKKLGVLS